jgi:hypothetical protein
MGSLVSFLAWLALAILLVASFQWKWHDPGIRVAGNVRVGASDGTIAIYNDSQPFFDGTVGMSGGPGWPRPKCPRDVSLRFPGFTFHHFTWPGEWPTGTYWTFAVALIYPLILTAIMPTLWLARYARTRRRRAAGLCSGCGYSLTGNISGVCPECGKVNEVGAARLERQSWSN